LQFYKNTVRLRLDFAKRSSHRQANARHRPQLDGYRAKLAALFSAAKAMSDVLATLKQSGRSEHTAGTMLNYDEFCALVDLDFHQELDDRFGD
jgi:hypothetical protein